MGEIVDDKIRTPATPERKTLKKVSVSVSVSISTAPYNVYELRSRRRRGNNPATSPTTTFEDATSRNSSTISDDVIVNNNNSSNFPDSCCSSNISSSSSSSSSSSNASVKNNLGDLEVESVGETSLKFDDRHKSASEIEMIKCGEEESGGVDYTTTKSTVEIKSMMMPSKSEIEDFFTSAENDLQKRFSDKYNFDIVKDVPLEGRYEWVEIKP